MPLSYIQVSRPIPGRLHGYGRFVVDSPYSAQNEVLASLTENDLKKIGYLLGITQYSSNPIPADTQLTLGMGAANPMDLFPTPAFISENGYKIWITRDEREIRL